MKFTKFGHSCMLVEEGGCRILLDPGSYSIGQNEVKNIDVVLITHEHQDHVDVASLKTVLANNPQAKIITNTAVAVMLSKEGIQASVVEHGQKTDVKGVSIEGIGDKHALIHSSIPIAQNTGYFIAGIFFYPGDALTVPEKKVDILGLPAAAPWGKVSEFIDYGLAVKPRVILPMHDGILKNPSMLAGVMGKIFEGAGIQFVPLEVGKEYEL